MNIALFLETSAEKFPDKAAVRHDGEIITYRDLNAACDHFAAGLQRLGLAARDKCVLMMPNSIKGIIAYFALAKLGVVIVPVNFLYRRQELEHIFTDAQPKGFIGAAPYLEEADKVLESTGTTAIRVAAGNSDQPGFTDFESVYAPDVDFTSFPANPEDTLNILYTSGTTGRSKGVMLTHGNLASEARILTDMRGKLGKGAVVVGVLPLYHVYGITSVLNVSFYQGLSIELFTQFDPEAVIDLVAREKQTILFAVPTMYNRLIQIAGEAPPEHSSLEFCVSGGASLPVEFIRRFESLFSTKIYEGYGLTEAPVCVENPYGGLTKPGSIGLPIPEFEATIVNAEGSPVAQGEPGELLIKGPGVMKGYLNRPEETEETLKDGWLHTGDIARMDKDGYVYIVDRKKDLIIRGGYNVYPREIEEVIYQMPEIQETAVIGFPHADLGEEVMAIVVLNEGVDMQEDEIRNYVKQRVAPYKYPRVIQIRREPLPKSGTGKILKKDIRKSID